MNLRARKGWLLYFSLSFSFPFKAWGYFCTNICNIIQRCTNTKGIFCITKTHLNCFSTKCLCQNSCSRSLGSVPSDGKKPNKTKQNPNNKPKTCEELENIEDLQQAVKISKFCFVVLFSGDLNKIEYMNIWVLQSSAYSDTVHVFPPSPRRVGDVAL